MQFQTLQRQSNLTERTAQPMTCQYVVLQLGDGPGHILPGTATCSKQSQAQRHCLLPHAGADPAGPTPTGLLEE